MLFRFNLGPDKHENEKDNKQNLKNGKINTKSIVFKFVEMIVTHYFISIPNSRQIIPRQHCIIRVTINMHYTLNKLILRSFINNKYNN